MKYMLSNISEIIYTLMLSCHLIPLNSVYRVTLVTKETKESLEKMERR